MPGDHRKNVPESGGVRQLQFLHLARDVKYLEERGYRTERVRCVDMFPHSGHVECVVKLEKMPLSFY